MDADSKKNGGIQWGQVALAGFGGFALGFGAGYVTRDMQAEAEAQQGQKTTAAK